MVYKGGGERGSKMYFWLWRTAGQNPARGLNEAHEPIIVAADIFRLSKAVVLNLFYLRHTKHKKKLAAHLH